MVVIAGTNGLGKTTLRRIVLEHDWLDGHTYIDADDIAEQELGGWNSPEAVRQAARVADERREACLAARESFAYETVFSTWERVELPPFVFPSEDGHTNCLHTRHSLAKVIAKAESPSVTPHTLCHTIGSASVSTSETLAIIGALLGHVTAQASTPTCNRTRPPRCRPRRLAYRGRLRHAVKCRGARPHPRLHDEKDSL
jgi:hypothetical protein